MAPHLWETCTQAKLQLAETWHHFRGSEEPSLGKWGGCPSHAQGEALGRGLALVWVLFICNAAHLCSSVFPSLYPWRVRGCGHMLVQAINQVSPWQHCTAPIHQSQVFSCHSLLLGPYQSTLHSVLIWIVLSATDNDVQSLSSSQGQVVIFLLQSPGSHHLLFLKPFLHSILQKY